MKKVLVALFLGLLFCNIVQAKECAGSPLEEKKLTLTFFKVIFKWKDCHGTLIYKDGSKYVGDFKWGKFSGRGIFTWLDGVKYVGEFKAGKRHGQGTYTWGDGTIDNGVWKKDKLVKRNKIEILIDKKDSKKKEVRLVKKKPIKKKRGPMKSFLEKREAMAVMIIQAIICKREAIRPSPKQAAELAVEHTDSLLHELNKERGEKVKYLNDWNRRRLQQ